MTSFINIRMRWLTVCEASAVEAYIPMTPISVCPNQLAASRFFLPQSALS